MTTRVKSLIQKIERQKKRIAKERDKLSVLFNEISEILDCCDDAEDHLRCAIDSLSELLREEK